MTNEQKQKAVDVVIYQFCEEYDEAMSQKGQSYMAALRKLVEVCDVPFNDALMTLEKKKCYIDAIHEYTLISCIREIPEKPES